MNLCCSEDATSPRLWSEGGAARQADPAAEPPAACGHQSRWPGSVLPGARLPLPYLSASSFLVALTEKQSVRKKEKFSRQRSDLYGLTGLAQLRGQGDVRERRDLRCLCWRQRRQSRAAVLSAYCLLGFVTPTAWERSAEILKFLKHGLRSSSASLKYVPEFMTLLVDTTPRELIAVVKKICHCLYSSLCMITLYCWARLSCPVPFIFK